MTDFEESVDPDSELTLGAAGLFDGCDTLGEMQERLRRACGGGGGVWVKGSARRGPAPPPATRARLALLEGLEADGWRLASPVLDDIAYLDNPAPKPRDARRVRNPWRRLDEVGGGGSGGSLEVPRA